MVRGLLPGCTLVVGAGLDNSMVGHTTGMPVGCYCLCLVMSRPPLAASPMHRSTLPRRVRVHDALARLARTQAVPCQQQGPARSCRQQ